MKNKKIIKKGLIILVIIITGFLIYSFIPRVIHHENSYGAAFPESDMLPDKTKEELRIFINDTASRMQSVVVIFEVKLS